MSDFVHRMSLFRGARDNAPTCVGFTSDRFVEQLLPHEFREPDDKLGCDAFSPAFYPEHAHRGNANVESLSLWVGDLDAVGDDEFERFLAGCRERRWAVAYFSTWSHASKPGVSVRPVLPPSRAVSPDEWPDVWSAINDALGGLSDPKCKDPARLYFGPTRRTRPRRARPFGTK